MTSIINKARTAAHRPDYLAELVLVRLGSIFGNREYHKFIVLSGGRTGSSMLMAMLDSHPSIHAQGESFMRLRGRSVDSVLSGAYRRMPRRTMAVGFKIHYSHPADDNSGMVWDRLEGIADLRIIHLKRRNVLRTLASREIARRTGVYVEPKWKKKTLSVSDKQIEFAASELIELFERMKKWERTYEERFRAHRIIDVYYEDIANNPEAELRRIAEFLDLEPTPWRVHLKRQNPESLRELISNYDSLKQGFENTEWYCHFDE